MQLCTDRAARFRWVVCQLDVLRRCRSPAKLKKALKSLPKTLDETYDRILASIEEDDKRDALNLLQWLAFSVRTISLDEAVEVLATDPSAEDGCQFDPQQRLRDPRDVLSICSSLVTLTNLDVRTDIKKGDGDKDEETSRDLAMTGLKLAHFSVREYLVSDYLRQSSDTRVLFYHFDKIADTLIATTCLAYLLQFNRHKCVGSNTALTHPLSVYAASYWMDHARSDTDGQSEPLHKHIMDLLKPMDPVYTNWISIHDPSPYRYTSVQRSASTCTPLYYTALGGLERASRTLLSNGSDVNAQGGGYGHCLQAASAEGHDAIVRLLIAHGADVNAQGVFWGNGLQGASFGGHYATVQMLLEHGADVNAQGGDHRNALSAASFQGHYTIVQLLLLHGADVNAPAGNLGIRYMQPHSWVTMQSTSYCWNKARTSTHKETSGIYCRRHRKQATMSSFGRCWSRVWM